MQLFVLACILSLALPIAYGQSGLAVSDVTVTGPSPAIQGEGLIFTVNFQSSSAETIQSVTGGVPTLLLNANDNAAAEFSSFTGTTLVFNYTVGPADDTPILDYTNTSALQMNGATITDQNGATITPSNLVLPTPGSATTDPVFVAAIQVDGVNPSVVETTSTDNPGNYTIGAIITITVAFDEDVTTSGIPTLSLNSGGFAVLTSTGADFLVFTYTVVDTDETPVGESLMVTGLSSGSITDLVGNPVDSYESTVYTGTNETFTIYLNTVPSVTGVFTTQASGVFNAGTIIPITISWSEPTYLFSATGNIYLNLTVDNGFALAFYFSGNGTDTWVFNYTVQDGDNTATLDYTSPDALVVEGFVVDADGNLANLTLPAPGLGDSLAASNIEIDTIAPTVVKVRSSNADANGMFQAGDTITIVVTFSEAVDFTNTSTPAAFLVLDNGNLNSDLGEADLIYGSGSTTLVFQYTVQALDVAAPLDYVNTTALILNVGTSITDAAGNDADVTLPAPGSANSLSASGVEVVAPVNPDFYLIIIYNEKLTCSDSGISNDFDAVDNAVTEEFSALYTNILGNHTCASIPSKKRQTYVSFVVATYALFETEDGAFDYVSNHTDELANRINSQVSNVEVVSIEVVSDGRVFVPTLLGLAVLVFSLLMRD